MQVDYTKASGCTIESLGICEMYVYDLEVETVHNFFANSILVHNTDSVYLNVQSVVDKFCKGKTQKEIVDFLDKFGDKVCQPIINESVQEVFDKMNCYKKLMSSKREAIASKILFRAKKNYACYVHNSEGVAYDPPKLKCTGIEIVRSSTPKWCRDKLTTSLRMIFESDELSFRQYFAQLEKDFMKLTPDEIAFPKGVSDIDKWIEYGKTKKGIPFHVRAANNYNVNTKKYNTLQQIQNGDKTKIVYLKMPNTIQQNAISFPSNMKLPKELNLDQYVDYQTQFFKAFEHPLKTLTDCAKWSLREEASLEDFFS
jgi:uncharacterized protein YbcV (DUF1398 family)